MVRFKYLCLHVKHATCVLLYFEAIHVDSFPEQIQIGGRAAVH